MLSFFGFVGQAVTRERWTPAVRAMLDTGMPGSTAWRLCEEWHERQKLEFKKGSTAEFYAVAVANDMIDNVWAVDWPRFARGLAHELESVVG